MTYMAWMDDDEAPFEAPLATTAKFQPLLKGGIVIGFGAIAAAVLMVAIGGGRSSTAPASAPAGREASQTALIDPPDAIRISRAHSAGRVEAIPSSGTVADGRDWMFAPSVPGEPTAFLGRQTVVASALPEPAPAVESVRVMPLPSANPLFAARAPQSEAADRAEMRALNAQLVAPPLPTRNPLLAGRQQLAAVEPAERMQEPEPARTPPPAAPTPAAESMLPGPSDKFALYDIKARVVYMPNGEKLEAHSGYGDMFDDPRFVHKKMVGPTPPNVYEMKMRESLFHGVEAIRLNPVGGGNMFGRDGMLAHTYMLGPRGDSNGCVSFRDYPKFLTAFKRGEINRLVVVTSLPSKPEPSNPILAWLSQASGR
ncbi:DUF2778 domain-containing protein [Azorhizobium doebereinerae]|uniref:DUF2778 domain-containing protein n=1 Tax=Azorhizobium doebereinerae TaxID=281091 RepID=UPI0004175D12|nr:DUF2778 domain-containing protein [Azorhizobium doebereinerae]